MKSNWQRISLNPCHRTTSDRFSYFPHVQGQKLLEVRITPLEDPNQGASILFGHYAPHIDVGLDIFI